MSQLIMMPTESGGQTMDDGGGRMEDGGTREERRGKSG